MLAIHLVFATGVVPPSTFLGPCLVDHGTQQQL
ncbi:hypothetical protein VTH82DRAFT_3828 [Thermothelomyces myriococcoides]